MTTKGFLLIATTHPFYGRMALNLCASIKAASPAAQVALLCDEAAIAHLNDSEVGLFDMVQNVNPEPGLKGVCKLRLQLSVLTPFEETIALDVDMMWLPKCDPARAFKLLEKTDFTISNEGFTDLETGVKHGGSIYTHWADIDTIQTVWDVQGKLYMTRGEFIAFRKTEAVDEVFRIAAEIQDDPMIETTKLGGAVTDEFALNIALNQCRMQPHKSPFEPAYWPALHGNILPAIYKLSEFYAVSFGGNYLPREAQKTYEIIAKNAAMKTGLKFRFPLAAKRNFLPERRKN